MKWLLWFAMMAMIDATGDSVAYWFLICTFLLMLC